MSNNFFKSETLEVFIILISISLCYGILVNTFPLQHIIEKISKLIRITKRGNVSVTSLA